MLNKKPSSLRLISSSLFTIIILAVSTWLIFNRQYALDQINVWQYKPTNAVQTIASRSGMNDNGKFYFYASRPAVETATQFNQDCQRQEVGNAILGCYTNRRVFVYDVANDSLDGIEEVTAAHEMLHAAWDRLSDSDKQYVSGLLEKQFNQINDAKFTERMSYYSRTEPGERSNELHSIIGTEVSSLSPELEAYYGRYFSGRQSLVALRTAYNSVFTTLDSQAKSLAAELEALVSSVNLGVAQYNTEVSELSQEIVALNARADSVDRTSVSAVRAYNAKRSELLARVSQLDASRATIDSKTADYKAKLDQYNQLVVRSNALTSSIDSSLAPVPSL